MSPEQHSTASKRTRESASESPFGRAVLASFPSLSAFAGVVGVSAATVYRARHGAVPTDLHLRAIANGLGMTEARARSLIRKGAR